MQVGADSIESEVRARRRREKTVSAMHRLAFNPPVSVLLPTRLEENTSNHLQP